MDASQNACCSLVILFVLLIMALCVMVGGIVFVWPLMESLR